MWESHRIFDWVWLIFTWKTFSMCISFVVSWCSRLFANKTHSINITKTYSRYSELYMKRSSRKSTPLLTNKQTYFIFPFSIFAPVLCVLYFQSIHFLQSLAHTHTHTHTTRNGFRRKMLVFTSMFTESVYLFSHVVCVCALIPAFVETLHSSCSDAHNKSFIYCYFYQ